MWTCEPAKAWREHIWPHISRPWIEESPDISRAICLSKRELFALILLAHVLNAKDGNWVVGYDPKDGEPNDGFVTDGANKINIEHKLIPQMSQKEVLRAILETYEKYRKKSASYGLHRTLVIHANKGTKGLIKISELRRSIAASDFPFERVLFLSCSKKNQTWVMHITQHYPDLPPPRIAGRGITQVDFDSEFGTASVPHVGFELFELNA